MTVPALLLLQDFGFRISVLLENTVNYAFYVLLGFIIASILFSFFPGYPSSPFLQTIYDAVGAVVNPILMPIRSRIPPLNLGGIGLDLAPMIAILGLYIASGLLLIVISLFIQPVTG